MFLAEIDDVLVPVAGDVEIEQIFPHAQVAAEHDDPLIEVVHFEQREEHVVVWLLGGVGELL